MLKPINKPSKWFKFVFKSFKKFSNMEEIEIPTEHLHETINEKAKEEKEKWVLFVALSTAFIAVLAAIAGLLGGHEANEAMLDQIKASDQWALFQAKGIKSEIASSTLQILAALPNKAIGDDLKLNLNRYDREKKEIKTKAKYLEKSSEEHLSKHLPLSKAVTIFQIAIALSAISIITQRKLLWYIALLFMLGGSYFLTIGIL